MWFVMLGELTHASPLARPGPSSPGLAVLCPQAARDCCNWLLPVRGGSAGGKSPSSCPGPDLEPRSRLHRVEAAPVLHSLSPEPGEMPAEPSAVLRER